VAILQSADGSGGVFVIDPATDAARVQQRPLDVGSFGSYQGHFVSGTMAANLSGGSTIFSLRWGDATRTCLVRRVALYAAHVATAFTAEPSCST
jgi:hypothetical protein